MKNNTTTNNNLFCELVFDTFDVSIWGIFCPTSNKSEDDITVGEIQLIVDTDYIYCIYQDFRDDSKRKVYCKSLRECFDHFGIDDYEQSMY